MLRRTDGLPLRTLWLGRRRASPLWHSYEAALDWLLANRLPHAGIAVSSERQVPYPEVTGYLIPTLLECGERELAVDLARWLISIQRPDGGFAAPDDKDESYTFDTGQVLRGLLTVADLLPEVEEPIRRAADWLIGCGAEPQIVRPRPGSRWAQRYGGHISENIHLYTLPPLAQAGQRLGRRDYLQAVDKSLEYFLRKTDLLEFKFLTHFYGYVLEALVDLGQGDLARRGLDPIVAAQAGDGRIPGVPGADWVCSPGALQLAIVGYKVGWLQFANASLDYVQNLQLPSGGFFGSYGSGAMYAENEELSWACKYFLDACHWRVRTSFAQQHSRFRAEVDNQDMRLQVILAGLGDLSGKRILDVGCGRGQFLRLLQDKYPTAELWGVDLAEELLTSLPPGIHRKVGSMLNLPLPDAMFDAVLCVEALEHAVRVERAVSEMCRVLKPGGRIVILDKSIKHLGAMPIEVWEKWFDPAELAAMLERRGVRVKYDSVGAAAGERASSLLQIWWGTRLHPNELAPGVQAEPSRPGPTAKVLDRYRRASRLARAQQLTRDGFATYRQGDLVAARRLLLKAVALRPGWLWNRGVLSIVVESIVGSGAMGRMRQLVSNARKVSRKFDDGAAV